MQGKLDLIINKLDRSSLDYDRSLWRFTFLDVKDLIIDKPQVSQFLSENSEFRKLLAFLDPEHVFRNTDYLWNLFFELA